MSIQQILKTSSLRLNRLMVGTKVLIVTLSSKLNVKLHPVLQFVSDFHFLYACSYSTCLIECYIIKSDSTPARVAFNGCTPLPAAFEPSQTVTGLQTQFISQTSSHLCEVEVGSKPPCATLTHQSAPHFRLPPTSPGHSLLYSIISCLWAPAHISGTGR